MNREEDVKPGLVVKIGKLGSTTGMLVHEKHLKVRKSGLIGTVLRWIPGHGSWLWAVRHTNSNDVGAYHYKEFKPVKI